MGDIFDQKDLKFEIFDKNINQNTRINPIGQPPLSFNMKPITMLITSSTNFNKIDENLVKK